MSNTRQQRKPARLVRLKLPMRDSATQRILQSFRSLWLVNHQQATEKAKRSRPGTANELPNEIEANIAQLEIAR